MKRTISIILVIASLLMTLCACGTKGNASMTMDEIYDYATTGHILEHFDSFSLESKNIINGNKSFGVYMDKEKRAYVDDGYPRLFVDGILYSMLYNEDVVQNLFVASNPQKTDYFENVIFSENPAVEEKIISCNLKGDKYEIETKIDNSEFLMIQADAYGVEYVDGMFYKTLLTVDAKLNVILTVKEYFVGKDGKETQCLSSEITYNAKPSDVAKKLLDDAEKTPDVTFAVTMDPGTDAQQTITMRIPKGDIISLNYAENSYLTYIDEECTTQVDYVIDSVGAKIYTISPENGTILYAKRYVV